MSLGRCGLDDTWKRALGMCLCIHPCCCALHRPCPGVVPKVDHASGCISGSAEQELCFMSCSLEAVPMYIPVLWCHGIVLEFIWQHNITSKCFSKGKPNPKAILSRRTTSVFSLGSWFVLSEESQNGLDWEALFALFAFGLQCVGLSHG